MDSLQVSIVDTTEDIRYEMPNYEIKIVAYFNLEWDTAESSVFNEIRETNKKLERLLTADGEGRYVTANIFLAKRNGRFFLFVLNT